MRKAIAAAALVVLGLGCFTGVSVAHADAAPPQNPPGASVGTGKYQTQVQMISENVLMTIDDAAPSAVYYVPPVVGGHVDATFVMQNQGSTTEAFEVWFPKGADADFNIEKVENFKAWVDGVPAAAIGEREIPDDFGTLFPWATWPARFPPGKPVTLRVTYDSFGTGISTYGQLQYILSTGAGWYGPIGEGTVTFRLPYEVNELNTVLTPRDHPGLYADSSPTEPYVVSGTDVIWHFTNLEPTAANNIGLTVLKPSLWRSIRAAQTYAATHPDSVAAQLMLAKAATKGVSMLTDDVMEHFGGNVKLLLMAADAYEAADRLEPNNPDILIPYVSLLALDWDYQGIEVGPRFASAYARALKAAPNDPTLATLKDHMAKLSPFATEQAQTALTVAAGPYNDLSDAARLESTDDRATAWEALRLDVATRTATITPSATLTATPTDTPAPTPTEEYPEYDITLGPPPTVSPTATPTPAAHGATAQDWTGYLLLALVVFIIAATWLNRRGMDKP